MDMAQAIGGFSVLTNLGESHLSTRSQLCDFGSSGASAYTLLQPPKRFYRQGKLTRFNKSQIFTG